MTDKIGQAKKQNMYQGKSKWFKTFDKLPIADKMCDLKCENGRAWGYLAIDNWGSGWMINVTEIFFLGKDPDIGKVLKWRYINDGLPDKQNKLKALKDRRGR